MNKAIHLVPFVFVTACNFIQIDEPKNPGGNGGDEALPPVSEVLLIGVTPATDFRTSGRVRLTLQPRSEAGKAILSAKLKITVRSELQDTTVATEKVEAEAADPGAILSAAILLDESGSMFDNDPSYLRYEAAKQFIDELGDDDKIAVFCFEAYPDAGDPGSLAVTGIAHDFTTDKASAKAVFDLEAFAPGSLGDVCSAGSTPMYESTVETLAYYDAKIGTGEARRSLLLLGDGQPNGSGTRDEACEKATNLGIPINTVGLGPAADQSPSVEDSAVEALRELADCSGGAYSGVVEADGLGNAFSNLGAATQQGAVHITVTFSPIPDKGTLVAGTVDVSSGSEDPISVTFDFVAP